MRRKISILTAGFSLLLCIAASALWLRSYFAYDYAYLAHDSPGQSYWLRQIFEVRSSHGGAEIGFIHSHSPTPTAAEIAAFRSASQTEKHLFYQHFPPSAYPWCYSSYSAPHFWHWLGFEWVGGYIGLDPSARNVLECRFVFPYWSLVLLLLVQPALTFRKHRRGAHKVGTCRTCGYDLRASPARCPECGNAARNNNPAAV